MCKFPAGLGLPVFFMTSPPPAPLSTAVERGEMFVLFFYKTTPHSPARRRRGSGG